MTTYRKDGSALVTPVWFRHVGGAFEVVIAEGDIKLQHLRRDPRCALVVFEAVPPFRGVEIRGEAELVECDVRAIRAAIAGRYSGLKTANASPPSGRSLVSCCVSPERGAHGISRPSCRPRRRCPARGRSSTGDPMSGADDLDGEARIVNTLRVDPASGDPLAERSKPVLKARRRCAHPLSSGHAAVGDFLNRCAATST